MPVRGPRHCYTNAENFRVGRGNGGRGGGRRSDIRSRCHDVRVIHHGLAHPTAPIRLRLCPHSADSGRTKVVLGFVLLDIILKCELRAAHGRIFVESIGCTGQNNTSCSCLAQLDSGITPPPPMPTPWSANSPPERDAKKRRPISLGVTGRPNSAFARVPGGKNRH